MRNSNWLKNITRVEALLCFLVLAVNCQSLLDARLQYDEAVIQLNYLAVVNNGLLLLVELLLENDSYLIVSIGVVGLESHDLLEMEEGLSGTLEMVH
jgi:hypothetical protein